jgi:hypothetical protein
LTDSSDGDTTRHNLRIQFLPTVLIQLPFIITDLAGIYLTEQWHHLGVQHRREELHVKSRMAKTFLQLVAFVVGTFRVNFGLMNFLFSGREVPELL